MVSSGQKGYYKDERECDENEAATLVAQAALTIYIRMTKYGINTKYGDNRFNVKIQ